MQNKIKSSSNQLRWVVLLLTIAVILPAAGLLWFMTQAVKNERLAIKQKMIDTYTSRSQEIFYKYPPGYRNLADKNLTSTIRNLTAKNSTVIENLIQKQNYFSSLVIYDQNDKLIYPVQSNYIQSDYSEILKGAWKLEYADKNYEEAIKQYEQIGRFSSIFEVISDCKIAVARCLAKQNKTSEAIEKCRMLAYPEPNGLPISPAQISYARLELIYLYSQTNNKDLSRELQSQISDITKLEAPTETKIFIFEELKKTAEKSGLARQLNTEIQNAKKTIDSAGLAVTAADYFGNKDNQQSKTGQVFIKIQAAQPLYCIRFQIEDKNILGLLTVEKMGEFWQKTSNDFTDELVFCRIYDGTGEQIAGEKDGEGEIFSTLYLKNYFSGWKTELYFRPGIFKGAADKRMFAYIWAAAAVIVLMLTSTLLASKAVFKQAKLNKLKNDFIATVTHELKTPLSSMRVLVDTLLEGRCQNKQQETEYLQLISKENTRLSKLIDNFLTFSRMERNKQAFDFAPVNPAEIITEACDAVQTKFNKENCKFTVTFDDNLPSIMADKDALAGVLVNLLDNAYKYSQAHKQIELKCFADKELMRFEVKDNGIGMTRRQMKKIFDRFYQADTSLSRITQGAGLGLSIVKFIVDAHKGKIDVESKVGKGSIFTVTIPIIKK